MVFRVGSFDPYSDDPRLAVKKVLFCGDSGVLVVGGTAGQVIWFERNQGSIEGGTWGCVNLGLAFSKNVSP